jgi:Predicted membrane protein (DUF2207) C-terminal domain
MALPLDFRSAPNIAFWGTVVVISYYALAWFLFGRSPRRGPIVIRYEPPNGMSPAAIRYLWKGGLDERGFVAAILSLSVQGIIQIEEIQRSYFVNPAGGDPGALPADEKELAEALLPRGFGFELNAEHHDRIYRAISALKIVLGREIDKKLLVNDSALLAPGIFGSVLLFLYLTLTGPFEWRIDIVFLTLFWVFWSQVSAVLLLYLIHYARSAKWFRDRTGNSMGGFVKILMFSLPCFAVELAVLGFLAWLSAAWFVTLLLIHVLLIPATHLALRGTTKSGSALMAQIEGFRKFLAEVEADPRERVDKTSPVFNPALFEKYFPFAFALDVQDQWARRFSDIVAADSGGLEFSTTNMASNLLSLDLTAFGLFVQKWFPFELGEIKISIGPKAD